MIEAGANEDSGSKDDRSYLCNAHEVNQKIIAFIDTRSLQSVASRSIPISQLRSSAGAVGERSMSSFLRTRDGRGCIHR